MNVFNVRNEVKELEVLGPLPAERGADSNLIQKYEILYKAITRPITDDEARILIRLFGTDGCFGLASALMHLIETAPGWPLEDCLTNQQNEWVVEMRNRCVRAGRLPPV